MRTLKSVLLTAALLGGMAPAFGWNATGHMVIGAIAEPRLNARAKTNIDRLLALDAEPQTATFITAGVWMDDIRAGDVRYYDRWHYTDAAHSPDETPLPKRPHADNVVFGMNVTIRALKSRRTTDAEKARALRLLIHMVQDVHNPLHCGTRYTRDRPQGDRGGNDFRLTGAGGSRNLHAYWDSAIGLFPRVSRPLPPDSQPIAGLARTLTARYPESRLPAWRERRFTRWVAEGHRLLTTVCYPDAPTPSEAYKVRAREAAEQRVALAGYRLADLLNRIWP